MGVSLNLILRGLMKKSVIKEYDTGDWHVREWDNGWIEQELRHETLGSALTPTKFDGGYRYYKEFDLPVEMASRDYTVLSNFYNFGASLGSSATALNSKRIAVIGHSVSWREDKTIIMAKVSGHKKV